MRGRGLLILALVVVALAAFIGLYERKLPSSDTRREQSKHVLKLKKKAIDAITLERPGEPSVELVRVEPPTTESQPSTAIGDATSAGWTLHKPWEFPAATSAVDSLVDTLVNLEQKRQLTDYKAADLGLDKPRARVTLHTASGQSTLEVGSEVPGFSSMTVRVAGAAPAYVVSDGLWDELNKKAGDWRSHDVLNGSRSDIDAVSWSAPEGAVALQRKGSDFRVAKPFQDVADQDLIDKLMTGLTGLQVDHFLDAADGKAAAEAASRAGVIHLHVELQAPKHPLDLELSPDEPGQLTARYEGQVAVCKSDLLDVLGQEPADWRSKSWTTLHVYDVHQATIRDGSGTVRLSRTEDGWSRDGTAIPFEVATDVLDTVTGAKATGIRPASKGGAPTGKPAITVVLTPESGDSGEQTLSLYGDGTGLNSARDVVMTMPKDLLTGLQSRVRDLRAAKAVSQEKPATPEAGAKSGRDPAAD